MPRIHAYLRPSSDKQTEISQRQQLDQWATATDNPVTVWWRDVETGATRWQDRQLGAALADALPGDTIVVSEISRIARSTVGVLTFLQEAASKQITVHAVQSRITLDGSLQATITVTVLALCAEIERELLRARTRAAIDARRAAGLPVGRQPGTAVSSRLDQRSAEIQELLAAHISKRGIARILDVSPATLYAWIRRGGASATDTKTLTLPGIEPPPRLPGTRAPTPAPAP